MKTDKDKLKSFLEHCNAETLAGIMYEFLSCHRQDIPVSDVAATISSMNEFIAFKTKMMEDALNVCVNYGTDLVEALEKEVWTTEEEQEKNLSHLHKAHLIVTYASKK